MNPGNPPPEMRILYDEDIADFLTYAGCIEVLEEVLRSKLVNNVVHPPRDIFPTQSGSMTITKGELLAEKVAGFRLYGAPKTTQMTVTMDTETGEFKGLIIGKKIGVYRTACLNAIAIKYLSRQNSRKLGVIGSGYQARHHTLAALEVRKIDEICVYSRSREKCEEFIAFVQERKQGTALTIVAADTPEAVVEHSDILICATNSGTPILSTESLQPGLHLNNIGPKYIGKHELPYSAYHKADILCTDSLTQLYHLTPQRYLCFADGIPREQVIGLEHFMDNFQRPSEAFSLFCSMGLGGSEVAVSNWILESMGS